MVPEDDRPKRPPKRLRIRKCLRKLHIPADGPTGDTTFVCQEEVHGADKPHMQRVLIHMPNGTGRDATITWIDLGVVDMRKRTR